MPITLRPNRRFPVQCSVTYNAGLIRKLPLACFLGFGSCPLPSLSSLRNGHSSARCNVPVSLLSRLALDCLTPELIAPRVMLIGVKLR